MGKKTFRLPATSSTRAAEERDDSPSDPCPVCGEDIEVYALGQCNHPICFRCSIKMRYLCEQIICPICRSEVRQVAFLTSNKDKKRRFETINLSSLCLDRKAMIFSETEEIRERYLRMIRHECTYCSGVGGREFESFRQLRDHVTEKHGLRSCDLCSDNLKLFTSERKFYDESELAGHNESGDPDNRSYRGHPLCEFCDVRYFDRDALTLHLRKDHYFCHFCEADGNTRDFYCHYEDLKQHFREEHFLCEEGDCATTQWMHAFRSDIDLKVHVAKSHAAGLDRSQARRLRNLELPFARPEVGHESRNSCSNTNIASLSRKENVATAPPELVDVMHGGATPNRGSSASLRQLPPPLTIFEFPTIDGRLPVASTPSADRDRRPELLESRDQLARRVVASGEYKTSAGDFPCLAPLRSRSKAGKTSAAASAILPEAVSSWHFGNAFSSPVGSGGRPSSRLKKEAKEKSDEEEDKKKAGEIKGAAGQVRYEALMALERVEYVSEDDEWDEKQRLRWASERKASAAASFTSAPSIPTPTEPEESKKVIKSLKQLTDMHREWSDESTTETDSKRGGSEKVKLELRAHVTRVHVKELDREQLRGLRRLDVPFDSFDDLTVKKKNAEKCRQRPTCELISNVSLPGKVNLASRDVIEVMRGAVAGPSREREPVLETTPADFPSMQQNSRPTRPVPSRSGENSLARRAGAISEYYPDLDFPSMPGGKGRQSKAEDATPCGQWSGAGAPKGKGAAVSPSKTSESSYRERTAKPSGGFTSAVQKTPCPAPPVGCEWTAVVLKSSANRKSELESSSAYGNVKDKNNNNSSKSNNNTKTNAAKEDTSSKALKPIKQEQRLPVPSLTPALLVNPIPAVPAKRNVDRNSDEAKYQNMKRLTSSRPVKNSKADFPGLPTGKASKPNPLTVSKPKPKIVAAGIWPLAPEICLNVKETPEERLASLVLVEKSKIALESLKSMLFQLNSSTKEPEDFYSSCARLLGYSLLDLAFKDIMACVKSAKERAKLLALHHL